MKMNHVILLPSGEGIRNQLISVIDFLYFFFYFIFFWPAFENITVPCIHLWNEKCNCCAQGSAVGSAAAFPALWEALPAADCARVVPEFQNSTSWQRRDVAGQRISPLSS